MQTFIVFGDPRRADKNTTFTANIPQEHLAVDGSYASVTTAGRRLDGAVLSYQDPEVASGQPAHLSVIVSEQPPASDLAALLAGAGWTPALTAPRAVTIPFTVQATLLLADTDGDTTWHTTLWLDRALVPTQRWQAHVPGGTPFPARVLSMEPGDASPPTLLLHAEIGDMPAAATMPGWVPMPGYPVPGAWRDLARVASAVEANVGYLLATPIVTDVTIHDVDQVHPDDLERVLPRDVAEELATALTDLGREDLIPEGFVAPAPPAE